MGRSANSFAFLLVFVLLALVIYFVYQAATGASGTEQALVALPRNETPNPDRFISSLPKETIVDPNPVVPTLPTESKEKAVVPPLETGKTPGEGLQKPDELPPPPKLPETPLLVDPVDPGLPSIPAPAISKQEELLSLDKEYTTGAGDTPWLLAVLLLGDGTHWREIIAANPVLSQDGRSPEKETALPAGLRVKAPKDVAPKPDSPVVVPAGQPMEHKIVAGDTLSAIMQRYYGENSMSVQKEILAENLDLDPELLKVNALIKLPVISGKGPKSGS